MKKGITLSNILGSYGIILLTLMIIILLIVFIVLYAREHGIDIQFPKLI